MIRRECLHLLGCRSPSAAEVHAELANLGLEVRNPPADLGPALDFCSQPQLAAHLIASFEEHDIMPGPRPDLGGLEAGGSPTNDDDPLGVLGSLERSNAEFQFISRRRVVDAGRSRHLEQAVDAALVAADAAPNIV